MPCATLFGANRDRYAGRPVPVVDTGHSATGILRAPERLAEEETGTRMVWVIRGRQSAKLLGGGDAGGLPARGKLSSRLKAVVPDHVLHYFLASARPSHLLTATSCEIVLSRARSPPRRGAHLLRDILTTIRS